MSLILAPHCTTPLLLRLTSYVRYHRSLSTLSLCLCGDANLSTRPGDSLLQLVPCYLIYALLVAILRLGAVDTIAEVSRCLLQPSLRRTAVAQCVTEVCRHHGGPPSSSDAIFKARHHRSRSFHFSWRPLITAGAPLLQLAHLSLELAPPRCSKYLYPISSGRRAAARRHHLGASSSLRPAVMPSLQPDANSASSLRPAIIADARVTATTDTRHHQ